MNKRKFKSFLDVVTVLLILAPIIFIALALLANVFTDNEVSITEVMQEIAEQSVLSKRLREKVYNALDRLGIFWYAGNFAVGEYLIPIIISNSLVIYMARVFIGVMVWLPKFASKLLERWCDI